MKYSLSLLAFASSISFSGGAVLARWTPVSTAVAGGDQYDGAIDTPTASETAANVTVSALSRVVSGGDFGNVGPVWPGTAADGVAGADLSNYTSFTLTPNATFAVDLDTVSYNYNTYGQINPGGYQISLRTSADGYASEVASIALPTDANSGVAVLDLSSLTGITEATEMRLYAAAPTGNGGNRWFDLVGSDTETNVGLIVNGEVNAVPEPSSALLAGLAGLFLLRRRR